MVVVRVSAIAVGLLLVACSRHDDDRSIKAAPDQAEAITSAAAPAPPPLEAANGATANPLAMPLKHDGPAPAAAASAGTKDPCDVSEPAGPLAMPLKHGAAPRRNPLCMKLK
jgi:hypothetical protein